MIEISHQQARYLIRQGSDGRRLPDEQWSILQTHLEGCVDCQAYRQLLIKVAHDLQRDLQLRWHPVHGPRHALAEGVVKFRQRRKQWRKVSMYSGFVALGLFLILLYAGYRRITTPLSTPTPEYTLVSSVASPTPRFLDFRGVVAYESRQDGNSEIYLLNLSGGTEKIEQVNLTNNPANDTNPTWSPDGEWLAFLSDRSGNREVYVIHLAGSRLTQLTANPGMIWDGPLTWSHDGRWLGLVGQPNENSSHWVYLIPLDGSGPRSIGFTRGASGAVRFSPSLPMLAYGTSDPLFGGLMAYRTDTSTFIPVTWQDNYSRGMLTGYADSFEWSADGQQLAYLAKGRYDFLTGQPDGSQQVQLLYTLPLTPFARGGQYDSSANVPLTSQPGADGIRGVSWSPAEAERLIAYLWDEEGTGCWTVHLHDARNATSTARNLPGLCVEGGLSYANWSPNSQWLVLLARQPGEETAGYYALRVPRNLSAVDVPVFERLVDVPVDATLDHMLASLEPRVRPEGQMLNIQPGEVTVFEPRLPQSTLTRDMPGKVIYNVMDDSVRILFSLIPGDSRPQAMDPKGHNRSCPTISPSGDRVAFLSDMNSTRSGVNEVFTMQPDGSDVFQLTMPVFPYSGNEPGAYSQVLPLYSCPVWSPDGKWLVSVVSTSRGSYLTLIDSYGGPIHYTLVPRASFVTGPVWSLDGRYILLPSYGQDSQSSSQILRVDAAHILDDRLEYSVLVESTGWDDVWGMAYSPDGSQIAYLTANNSHPSLPTVFDLRVIDSEGNEVLMYGGLYESDSGIYYGANQLFWLQDGRIGLVAGYRIDALIKNEILLYDPTVGHPVTLGSLGDIVFDSAWSADGSWLVYSAETGLWALDIPGALEGISSPALLDPRRVYEVDWR